MCPTPIGRIQTRTAILIGPAIIGLVMSLVTGHWDWLVLVGVYYLLGVFLDAAVYSWLLPWQPPFVGLILALAEFGLLLVLAGVLNDETGGGLSNIARLYTRVPALLKPFVFSDSADTPIVAARHGDSSGVRGAAWLWP